MMKKRVRSVLVILVMVFSIIIAPTKVYAVDAVTAIAQFIANGETIEVSNVEDFVSNFNGMTTQSGEVTVKLLQDIDLGEFSNKAALNVAEESQVKLDLNSKRLYASLNTTGDNYWLAQIIYNEGNLKITDESVNQLGVIENTQKNSNACTRTIKNGANGDLTLNSVIIRTQSGVGLMNLGMCSIVDTKVESLKEGHSGGWDNAVAAIEQRGESGSTLTIHSGTFISKSQSTIFCDEAASKVIIHDGNFEGNLAYGVFNGSTAETAISVRGGKYNTDPSQFVDGQYYVVPSESGSYIIEKKDEIKKVVLTEGELSSVLEKYDIYHPVEVVIKGNVSLTKNASISAGSTILIDENAVLTIDKNAVLSLDAAMTNNGEIVGHGYVSNPLLITGSGAVTGLPLEGGNYNIDSASDLQWLTYVVEHLSSDRLNVTLTNDITMPDNIVFQPISSGDKVFQGDFNGNYHKIDKLTLKSGTKQLGMFYSLANSTVKNLSFSDANVETDSGYTAVVVANSIEANTFKNITVDGVVKANGTTYALSAIAASISTAGSGETRFINCTNKAQITGANAYNIGSMFGTASKANENIYVYNCRNEGNITAKGSFGYVFGFGHLSSIGKVEIIGFVNNGLVNGGKGVICNALGSGYTYNADNADGNTYVAIQENNTWKAVEKTSVQAIVDGDYYLDADKAIEESKDGDTVQFLNNAKLDKNHTILKNITIIDSTKESFIKLIADDKCEKTISGDTCVFRKLIFVENVTLNQSTLTLKVGDFETLIATVTPNDADDKSITWTTSDKNIATVDENGKVTAIRTGIVKITAKVGDKLATCDVSVYEIAKPEVPDIKPTDPSPDVSVGITDKESVKALDETTQSVVENIISNKSETSVSDQTAENVKKAIQDGKTVRAEVEVAKIDEVKVPTQDRQTIDKLVEQVAGINKTTSAVVQYIDLSIILTTGDTKLGTIDSLNSELSFTVVVPEEFKKEGRKFYMVRLHDGKVEKLETFMNDDGTLTFKTDLFSTYALVYEDKIVSSDEPEKDPSDNIAPVDPKPSDDNDKGNGGTVQTGDTTEHNLYIMMGTLSLVLGCAILVCRRKDLSIHND